MDILTFDQLPQGGFAGLKERQFVLDDRIFPSSENTAAFNGIGNFVYLADANFMPNGETGMHGHREIDVISVMVEGRVSHAGSLEHGQELKAGTVQVQRAGGEGFRHNEINPDAVENRMIQLWVLPDQPGESAGYKVYQPAEGELTAIYGGSKEQDQTFYSSTHLSVIQATAGQEIVRQGEVMAYLCIGDATINGQQVSARTLLHSNSGLDISCNSDTQIIFIFSSRDHRSTD